MSAPSLVDRLDALTQFETAAQGHLADSDLGPARELIGRAGQRLALSQLHTVVALAGPTGTGKSSIFNALAGLDLSQPGLRRPTTNTAHACVWGAENADALLDWLGVTRRFHRDGGSDPDLSGLVLIDLPDFDSVEPAHRMESDRLLSVVDMIMWVLNPQKYADLVVHKSYLAQFRRHGDITVVVLNQADLLSAEDLNECLIDLRRLAKADGLESVPVLTASTVASPGLAQVSEALRRAVQTRQAAVRRLSADLDSVTAALEPVSGTAPVARDALGKPTVNALTDALSRAAGVPMVAAAVEAAYVHRARKVTGWPPLRWLRRFRPDPLGRLHLGDHTGPGAPASSIGPAAPAAQAAVALALRATADSAGKSLPRPWQESILAAARSKVDDLPDALDRAVAQTDLGVSRTPWWWRAVGGLQWLAVAVAAAGLLWLGVRYAMFALALPEPPVPHAGRLPVPTALLLGGLLAGLLLSLFTRVVVRVAAIRVRRRAEARLRAGIERVARDFVVLAVQRVLDAYTAARDALRRAA